MLPEVKALCDAVRESNNIVFLGGAGVSTESGIPDFRSEDGLYTAKKEYGRSVEELLSLTFFMQRPDEFYAYYRKNLILRDAKPNVAHIALAQLEQQGKLSAIVTQNIDGLHQLAGSKSVIELHGSAHRNHCVKCNESYTLDEVLAVQNDAPRCGKCGSLIKPDVTLYEEAMNQEMLEKAIAAVSTADMLMVGGTSLVVYPAAGLVDCFHGGPIALLNKEETPYDDRADIIIRGSIGEVLQEMIENI